MKKIMSFFEEKPVIFSIALSGLLHLFIEILARRSLFDTFAYIIENPFITIYNCVIILFTLSIALYFSKKYSVFTIVCFVWLVLGVANSILMGLRGTPLSAVDFTIIKHAYTLIELYISVPLLIFLILLALAAISGIIFLFIRTPKIKPAYIKAVMLTALAAIFILCTSKSLLTTEAVASSDISKVYDRYGFACCFSYSLLGNGIDTPPTYSEDSMNDMLKAIDYKESPNPGPHPNIIFVQLESFFDPEYLDVAGISFSKEPIPNFKRLKEENISGFLSVPAFGGGTANTEFEVLTQLSIDNFGLGEYPYTTTLKENACESIAYNLKKNGYTTHAMHNHTATFYSRNEVYKNLGFDTFTSLEYMTNPQRNSLNWAKDSMLIKEIFNALDSTQNQDFIFAVSVQGHGQYPSKSQETFPISVSGIDDPEIKTNLEYYLSQINEMDMFIGDLIAKLSTHPEETMVVFYGDHLPCLKLGEINNNSLGYYPVSCDRYSTEYIIWNNFGKNEKDQDIPSYKLSSKVMDMVGINTGIVTQLNLTHKLSPENYNAYIKMCAYDMLYGNRYINNLENITPQIMKMGIDDIVVSDITTSRNDAYISGKGFTEYSTVYAGYKECKTTYISSTMLLAEDIPKTGNISVKQKSEGKILSSSNTISY